MESVTLMEQRHEQETKDLELKIRAMLKAAKKSEKKVVQAEIIQLQFDLKRRQERECDSMSDMGQSSPSLSDDRIDDTAQGNTSNKSRPEDEETSTETKSGHSTNSSSTESTPTTAGRKQQHSVSSIDHIETAQSTATNALKEALNVLVVVDDVHPRTSSMDEITPRTNPLHHTTAKKKKKYPVKKEAPMTANTTVSVTTATSVAVESATISAAATVPATTDTSATAMSAPTTTATTSSDDMKVEVTKGEEEKKHIGSSKHFETIIDLNVGGRIFTTTLSTLTRFPDTLLGAMFSGRHELIQDKNGIYFIDRDDTHFRTILNFLRYPESFSDSGLRTRELIELKIEAEFYGLKDRMFPISSSSTLNQSTRSTHSQSNPPEPSSQSKRSTRSQSNPPEPSSQTIQSQSNFPVKLDAPSLIPPAMPYNYNLPPPFVPTHAITEYPSSSFVHQPYIPTLPVTVAHIPVPPVTVPCTKTGTHIIISQDVDQIWHMQHKTFHNINFPVTVCDSCGYGWPGEYPAHGVAHFIFGRVITLAQPRKLGICNHCHI